MKERGSMSIDFLGWLILGLAALVIAIIVIFILNGKGLGAIGYLKNLLRFGN